MSSVSNLTPHDIIQTLSRIGKDIDQATEELSRLDAQVVGRRRVAEVQFAEAFLNTEGAMEIRKYTAKLSSEQANFELELAEQEHRAVVAHIRSLRDRLEIGRSISALVRMEWGNQI